MSKIIKLYLSFILLFLLVTAGNLHAQSMNWGTINVEDDDLTGGADIFSDFNEGLESSQVMEDERYYRYGRFFTASFGIGVTSFTGNRGIAYEDETPSYSLAVHQFLDFNSAYGMGIEYSKHHYFIDEAVKGYDQPPGMIEVAMMRFFFDIRHYIDTTDLGTAITFSNPYFVARIEYWYQTNKFIDQAQLGNESGGGLGFGAGIGLEFPIELKESFIGVEILLHKVNFFDKYTQNYRPVPSNPDGYGYEDLTGYAYSTMVSYVANW